MFNNIQIDLGEAISIVVGTPNKELQVKNLENKIEINWNATKLIQDALKTGEEV